MVDSSPDYSDYENKSYDQKMGYARMLQESMKMINYLIASGDLNAAILTIEALEADISPYIDNKYETEIETATNEMKNKANELSRGNPDRLDPSQRESLNFTAALKKKAAIAKLMDRMNLLMNEQTEDYWGVVEDAEKRTDKQDQGTSD